MIVVKTNKPMYTKISEYECIKIVCMGINICLKMYNIAWVSDFDLITYLTVNCYILNSFQSVLLTLLDCLLYTC